MKTKKSPPLREGPNFGGEDPITPAILPDRGLSQTTLLHFAHFMCKDIPPHTHPPDQDFVASSGLAPGDYWVPN